MLLIAGGVVIALSADAWFGVAAILLAIVQPWLSDTSETARRRWMRWATAGVWILDLGLWIVLGERETAPRRSIVTVWLLPD